MPGTVGRPGSPGMPGKQGAPGDCNCGAGPMSRGPQLGPMRSPMGSPMGPPPINAYRNRPPYMPPPKTPHPGSRGVPPPGARKYRPIPPWVPYRPPRANTPLAIGKRPPPAPTARPPQGAHSTATQVPPSFQRRRLADID